MGSTFVTAAALSQPSACPASVEENTTLADGLRVQRPTVLPSRTTCSWAPRLLQLRCGCSTGMLLLASARFLVGVTGLLAPQIRWCSEDVVRLDEIHAPKHAPDSRGAFRQRRFYSRCASTPAFDCNMGCHLAGDRLVGRCSGNSLDATLGGGLISSSTW